MSDYRTVAGDAKIEFVVNRSRFIGRCFKVETEAEALAHLERIRKEHWDATHNCYAYRIGERGETARFSDDGEPGGTAGLPMMDVLNKKDVTFVLAIATRYFGGILLGAGGLVRAYTKTTADAVDAAGLVLVRDCLRYSLTVDYPLWGRVEGFLRSRGVLWGEPVYTDRVTAYAAVLPGESEAFVKDCTELTDGRVLPVYLDTVSHTSPLG